MFELYKPSWKHLKYDSDLAAEPASYILLKHKMIAIPVDDLILSRTEDESNAALSD